jgi:hypothetical protein
MRIPRGKPLRHQASLPEGAPLPAGSVRRLVVVLAGAAAAGLAIAGLAHFVSAPPAPNASGEIAFIQYGVARSVGQVAIRDRPGGRTFARSAPGTRLGVGGRLEGAGVESDSYWVEVVVDGRLARGFADADEVEVIAGEVPEMDLGGVSVVSLAGWSPPDVRTGGLGIPWLPEPLVRWSPLFESAGEEHDIDPALLAIIALVESGGRPDVESRAGAVGLMQIMPGTAGDIARWRGLEAPEPGDLRDPERNVDFGAYYAARMLERFGSGADGDRSVELAAAAYNGGPGAATRWLEGGELAAETERYRGFVLGMWRERKRARSETFEGWCRAGGWRLLPPPHCRFG